jgi:uncharacterized HhH-GPD family protein
VALEGVEAPGQLGAVRLEPGVELPQGLDAEAVEATLGVAADLDEAGVAQHLEVAGHPGLVHPEGVDQLTHRALAAPHGIEDPAARRFGDHLEDVALALHHLQHTTSHIYVQAHVRVRARRQVAAGTTVQVDLVPCDHGAMHGTLFITGDAEGDELLNTDPLALVIGMLLDQQVPMEWAFSSPLRLKERLGGSLDAAQIAALPLDELEAVFKGPPALHRYPGSMAKRTQQLCQHLVEHHGGSAEAVWTGVDSGAELVARLRAIPGFGAEKSKIFGALLAKRFGVRPDGWEQATAPFSDATHRSVADIDSPEALAEVRAFKKLMKAKGKGKDG